MQTGNPGKCKVVETFETNFNRKVETSIHRHFQANRQNGEWFNLDAKQVSEFANICSKIEKNFEVLAKYNNPFI